MDKCFRRGLRILSPNNILGRYEWYYTKTKFEHRKKELKAKDIPFEVVTDKDSPN